MSDTAAGIMLDTLCAWGVDVIFGLPGDGINGLMEGLRQRQERLRFIQVRHEEAAAYMASGYARYARSLGACLATSGPGGIHLVGGLYGAKLEHLPVVAVTGHHYHDVIGTHTQQDVDLTKLFADVAIYSERVMGPAHAENVTHMACRSALGWRGVAHVNIPTDIQSQKTERHSMENVPHHQSTALLRRAVRPTEEALQRAAEVLSEGQRALLLCGATVRSARDEILRLADALAAPILSEELSGSPASAESPFCAGCVGMLSAKATRQALAECDTLVLLDAALPHSDMAIGESTRIIELVPSTSQSSPRDGIAVSLLGDLGATLQSLLPLLQRKDARDFLRQVRAGYEEFQRGAAAAEEQRDGRAPLPVLCRELSQRISEDGIFISELGALAAEPATPSDDLDSAVRIDPSVLPSVLAAQVAFPQRECVAVLSEASFVMLMAEFATAVKYQLPIRVLVLRDAAQNGAAVDLATFAQACGGSGFTMQSAADCADVLAQAFTTTGPALVAA